MSPVAIFLVFGTVCFAFASIAIKVLVRSRTGERINGRIAIFPLLLVVLAVAGLFLTWH